MKNSRLASWKTALPFLLPSLAGFVVFSIIPMIMQIFVSLTSWDGLSELTLFSDFSGFMHRFYVGVENYKEILTSKEFYQVIGNTLEFVILYIPLMLIASMIVALILNSHVTAIRSNTRRHIPNFLAIIMSFSAVQATWDSTQHRAIGAGISSPQMMNCGMSFPQGLVQL